MILENLKLGLRFLLKNKLFFGIEIINIAIGITFSILVFLSVRYEFSFEKFNKNADNVYRIVSEFDDKESTIKLATSCPGTGPLFKSECPEIADYVRLTKNYGVVSNIDNNSFFNESNIYYTEASFFKIFDIPLIAGDPKSLDEPNTAIITESYAHKYFGNKNPINQNLKVDIANLYGKGLNQKFVITGICKDIPQNSHLTGNIFLSYTNMINMTDGRAHDALEDLHYYVYVLSKEKLDIKPFQKKMKSLFVAKYNSRNTDNQGETLNLELQPIKSIHLSSNRQFELKENGSLKTQLFYIFMAIFILLISVLNYIIMLIAKISDRIREIGVRKILGSENLQIGTRFASEIFITLLLSIIVSCILILFFVALNHTSILNQPISIFGNKTFWIYLSLLSISILIIISVISSFYTQLIKPSDALKDNISKLFNKTFLRKALVVVQLIIATAFLISSITITKQVKYITNMKLGYDINNVLIINGPTKLDRYKNFRKYLVFRENLLQQPMIKGIGASSQIPGATTFGGGSFDRYIDNNKTITVNVDGLDVDGEYIDVYNIKIIAGKNYDLKFGREISELNEEEKNNIFGNVVISKRTCDLFQFKNPQDAIGKQIQRGKRKCTIIGVTGDYYHYSPKKNQNPMIFQYEPYQTDFYSIKFSEKCNTDNAIKIIKEEYKKIWPDEPFDYFLLSDSFKKQYEDEINLEYISIIFGIISIILSLLGVFSLSNSIIKKKTKEISIRKTLGASVRGVTWMQLVSYSRLIIIANLIAWPIAYIILSKWLNNYDNKISLNIYPFLMSFITILAISLASVIYHILKATLSNPSITLRND